MIAKRYANILMQRNDDKYFYDRLKVLGDVYNSDEKFKMFIDSSIIKAGDKVRLILSCFEDNTLEFENFTKLLAVNMRLKLFKEIADEMERQYLQKENISSAIIYTSSKISDDMLSNLERDLSSKFNTQIKLVNILHDGDLIKINLVDLGYELVLSPSQLKQKMKKFILEAI